MLPPPSQYGTLACDAANAATWSPWAAAIARGAPIDSDTATASTTPPALARVATVPRPRAENVRDVGGHMAPYRHPQPRTSTQEQGGSNPPLTPDRWVEPGNRTPPRCCRHAQPLCGAQETRC